MSNLNNWPISGSDGTAITVTATSTATLIGTDNRTAVAADVMIDNPGPNDVFVKAGGAGVVATLASVRVPAGGLQPYAKGSGNSYIAMITPAGSQAVVVHVGDGQ